MFNEVNAVLKTDGRSRKTKIVHLCKLKRCFGNAPIVSFNSREQSINECSMSNTGSNSFDPISAAPNQKGERDRMACANNSSEKITTHQLLDQVARVERDEHLLTVDGHDSGTTVVKLLSKGRRGDKKMYNHGL